MPLITDENTKKGVSNLTAEQRKQKAIEALEKLNNKLAKKHGSAIKS